MVAATACVPTLPRCVSFAVKFPKRESQNEDSACPGPHSVRRQTAQMARHTRRKLPATECRMGRAARRILSAWSARDRILAAVPPAGGCEVQSIVTSRFVASRQRHDAVPWAALSRSIKQSTADVMCFPAFVWRYSGVVVQFDTHQKMGTLARWGRLEFCKEPTLLEVNIMRKILTALVLRQRLSLQRQWRRAARRAQASVGMAAGTVDGGPGSRVRSWVDSPPAP